MTWGAPAATTRGHAYARSNTDIKKTHYKEQLLSSHLYNSKHLGTSVPDVPAGTSVPELLQAHQFLRREYSLAYGGRAFASSQYCDCNLFRAHSVCVCSPHAVIAISFGRIVSVFVVRSNLTAPRLAAKRRVMEERESESELGSRDITNDIPSLAPSTEPSGASYNNYITHSPPALAGTLH